MSLNRCCKLCIIFQLLHSLRKLCIDWKITAQFLFSDFATFEYDLTNSGDPQHRSVSVTVILSTDMSIKVGG